jgi:hypothetical protein
VVGAVGWLPITRELAVSEASSLLGKRVGRFRISESSGGRLVLTGRPASGAMYLLLAALAFAWAAAAWWAVLNTGHSAATAAATLTVVGLLLLAVAAARIGSRITFDRDTNTATVRLLFGLRTTTIDQSRVSSVSVSVLPATSNGRERAFLHLLNASQLVEQYVLSLWTDQPDAPTLFAVAGQVRSLLQLRPRVEGRPVKASPAFTDAYREWASQCPDGVQAVRHRVI